MQYWPSFSVSLQLQRRRPRQKPAAATEAPKTPVTGQIMAQDANTVLAKDFLGLAVYSPDKLKIGTINDLIMSKDAKTVEGFVIGVGGFLGIGEKNVALKMDRLQISNTPEGAVQLTMDAKKEELTNAPSFKSKRDMDLEKQADRTRNAPRVRPPTTSPRTHDNRGWRRRRQLFFRPNNGSGHHVHCFLKLQRAQRPRPTGRAAPVLRRPSTRARAVSS